MDRCTAASAHHPCWPLVRRSGDHRGGKRGSINVPAWKSKPSWYLIATDDRMIPPPAQQFMSKRARSTVVEVKGSHSVYVSKPQEVAALIETAARDAKRSAN